MTTENKMRFKFHHKPISPLNNKCTNGHTNGVLNMIYDLFNDVHKICMNFDRDCPTKERML